MDAVDSPVEQPDPDSPRAAIQREIVVLHKQFFGRGPTKTKLYLHDDAAVVLMYEGHTISEETMSNAGEERTVAQGRVDISEKLRQLYIEVVERHTKRKVIGFMSSSQQHPDLLSHVYVLQPTDLLSGEEGPSA